jgi:tetratricopeptide (TPR) repeat protein
MKKLLTFATALATIVFSAQSPVLAQSDAISGAEAKPDINRPIRDKWALVVGISNFQAKQIPRLKFASKDAEDFYNYLVKEGRFAPDHVRLLLNSKATQRRIMSEVGSRFLARLAKPDDLIVIFFSTHGSPSQMDIRGRNYLVAYDSDPEDLYASGIEMQKILESIQGRVLTDRVLLVLDACHSGSIDPNAKGIVRSANFDAAELAEGSGQLVICSSKPDEQSWESKRYENGVFTRNLLAALRSTPNANLSEAFSKMQTLVQDEVREDHPGARQTPVINSKWSGNQLAIAVPPKAPQTIPQTVVLDLEPDSSQSPNHDQDPVPATGSGQSQDASGDKVSGSGDAAAVPQVLRLTVDYFSKEQNPRKAYEEACTAQAAHFNEPDYYYRKACILIQLGNFSKAEQEFKGLLVDAPNTASYHLGRGYCFHRLGNNTAAMDEINMGLFHNPQLPRKVEFGD